MILADKIINERKKNGWSQEELAEKLGVSRQSVSKWEGAQSIPDLQKIVLMAEIFNVSTDYLLKDNMEPLDRPEQTLLDNQEEQSRENVRRIELQDANDFMETEKARAPKVALGVALCILSPVLLILLAGGVDEGAFHIKENVAVFLGLAMLFVLIAGGVYFFLTEGRRKSEFVGIDTEELETAYGVTGLVKERKAAYQETHNRKVTLSVIMYVLCALPLILVAVLEASDFLVICMVGVLLAIVAVATYIIVESAIIMNSYEILLQCGDFTKEKKREEKNTSELSSVFWCLVTAVYLGLSFWTHRWDRTWIIWPVAAVGYPVVAAIARLITGRRPD